MLLDTLSCMRLAEVQVERFRNFTDAQKVTIEADVTGLVGKNESGKTTVLKALHRLKPANGADREFNLTVEYPRWRLARDRRDDADLAKNVAGATGELLSEAHALGSDATTPAGYLGAAGVLTDAAIERVDGFLAIHEVPR